MTDWDRVVSCVAGVDGPTIKYAEEGVGVGAFREVSDICWYHVRPGVDLFSFLRSRGWSVTMLNSLNGSTPDKYWIPGKLVRIPCTTTYAPPTTGYRAVQPKIPIDFLQPSQPGGQAHGVPGEGDIGQTYRAAQPVIPSQFPVVLRPWSDNGFSEMVRTATRYQVLIGDRYLIWEQVLDPKNLVLRMGSFGPALISSISKEGLSVAIRFAPAENQPMNIQHLSVTLNKRFLIYQGKNLDVTGKTFKILRLPVVNFQTSYTPGGQAY